MLSMCYTVLVNDNTLAMYERRIAMAKLYRNKQGQKLYPVCSWEANQHKLYHVYDCAVLDCYDTEWSEEACEKRDRIEHAIDVFDGCVINGLVYATYEDSQIIKDYIWAYDAR